MYSTSQQGVENLTVSFDYLHSPSFGKTLCFTPDDSKRYKPQNPNYSVGGTPEPCVTIEEAVINKEPVRCRSCKKDHATYAFNYCPYTACKICFKTGHDPWVCPFLHNIPKDAEFDRANYEISCQCGNLFNVDKWVCTQCPGHPLLKKKYCSICCDFTQHICHDCPKDKVRAAASKSVRDHLLSRPGFPFVGEEEASSAMVVM